MLGPTLLEVDRGLDAVVSIYAATLDGGAAGGLRLRERSRPGNGWGMRAEGRSVRTQRVAP